MKRISTIVFIIIMAFICVFSSSGNASAHPMDEGVEYSRCGFYPLLTVVVNVTEEKDMYAIECVDRLGNTWVFYDEEEGWEEGDIANLLMMKVNDNMEEDEIIEVYWEGYIEP